MSRARAGWLPHQHGAWAMLFVPLVVGLAERSRLGLPAWAWPLAVTWVVGYFCFDAAGLWLKAAARRRRQFAGPLAAYGVTVAVTGATTVALEPSLLWWLVAYAPLLGTALWQTAHRHDRSLVAGLCEVLAACLLALVLPFTTPQAAWRAGWNPTSWHAAVLFGYFFGTVFVVKTLIRERNKPGWVAASFGWHLLWVVLATLAAVLGGASWWWVLFFVACSVRAWALPRFGPMRGRVIRPGQVGALEVVACLVVLLGCLL